MLRQRAEVARDQTLLAWQLCWRFAHRDRSPSTPLLPRPPNHHRTLVAGQTTISLKPAGPTADESRNPRICVNWRAICRQSASNSWTLIHMQPSAIASKTGSEMDRRLPKLAQMRPANRV